jgi:hypothetical protein
MKYQDAQLKVEVHGYNAENIANDSDLRMHLDGLMRCAAFWDKFSLVIETVEEL